MAKKYNLVIDGKRFSVEVDDLVGGRTTVVLDGESYSVQLEEQAPEPTEVESPTSSTAAPSIPIPTPISPAVTPAHGNDRNDGVLRSPMPGRIVEVKVEPGDRVSKGDIVLRFEAMKMENNILAPFDGVVTKVLVRNGEEVHQSAELMILEAD